MDAAENKGVIAWCRFLFTGILFPGTADTDTAAVEEYLALRRRLR